MANIRKYFFLLISIFEQFGYTFLNMTNLCARNWSRGKRFGYDIYTCAKMMISSTLTARGPILDVRI